MESILIGKSQLISIKNQLIFSPSKISLEMNLIICRIIDKLWFYKNIDNKKTEEFYLLMNRKLAWKDFGILKIFHIKKMILFSFNMVVFIKFLVKLFINRTELNP